MTNMKFTKALKGQSVIFCGLVWIWKIFFSLVWCLVVYCRPIVALFGLIIGSIASLISPFLAVIDPNSFSLFLRGQKIKTTALWAIFCARKSWEKSAVKKKLQKIITMLTSFFVTNANSQTVKHGLNDTIRKVSIMILYSFKNAFDALSDFGKNFVTKKLVPWNHSYLKYALVFR